MATTQIPPLGFADRLKIARDKAGLTQEDVAQTLGVSRQLVSRWENGRSYPDVGQLLEIARMTGAEWLLDVRNLPSWWIGAFPAHAA